MRAFPRCARTFRPRLSLVRSLSRCRLHFAEVFHSQYIVSRAQWSGGRGGGGVCVAVLRSHFLPFIECCPSARILALGTAAERVCLLLNVLFSQVESLPDVCSTSA